MPDKILQAIGMMSGTSMDGIDVALLKTDGENELVPCGHLHFPYSSEAQQLLKAMEYAIQKANGDLIAAEHQFADLFETYIATHHIEKSANLLDCLNHTLQQDETHLTLSKIMEFSTKLHIDAIQKFRTHYPETHIDCVGYHGQTVFHQPKIKKTIQIGLGEMLANATDLKVIYDVRSADVALGGQGAPFAPIYHRAIAIRDKTLPIGVINIGGIANVTLILSQQLEDLIGFDAGPGNCLLDRYVKQATKGREHMDRDGRYALHGKIHQPTLECLLEMHIRPDYPALDTHDFAWIPELEQLSLEDACATLVGFTVESIVKSLLRYSNLPKRYVLCGGGAYHPGIITHLKKRLQDLQKQNVEVLTADMLGWKNQAIEAELMAYLAVRRLKMYPFSFPKTTGVPYPLAGGKIAYPR